MTAIPLKILEVDVENVNQIISLPCLHPPMTSHCMWDKILIPFSGRLDLTLSAYSLPAWPLLCVPSLLLFLLQPHLVSLLSLNNTLAHSLERPITGFLLLRILSSELHLLDPLPFSVNVTLLERSPLSSHHPALFSDWYLSLSKNVLVCLFTLRLTSLSELCFIWFASTSLVSTQCPILNRCSINIC